LAVAVGRLEHDGVLCGRLSTDDVLFDAFFSVGVQICHELICAKKSAVSPMLQSPTWGPFGWNYKTAEKHCWLFFVREKYCSG
jgi:hypothetical protein